MMSEREPKMFYMKCGSDARPTRHRTSNQIREVINAYAKAKDPDAVLHAFTTNHE